MYQEWKYDEYRQVGKDYSQAAEVEVYDASHAQFRDVETENAALLAKLGLRAGSAVLDIGCGTGEFAMEAARAGHRVTAIDVSPAMLVRARGKASEAGLANLSFVHAGYLDFELEAGSMDAVTSSFSLHHLPDYWKGVALDRISRCLKAGGLFFLRDVVMPDQGAAASVSRFIEEQERLGGDFLRDDAIGHFRDEFSTYDWVMRGLLERSGFRIRTVETSSGVLSEYLCEV
ncbi:class I SAM-dependent methyltransferase [Pelagicoccus sp. SDUM812005]|uniref:class I SAM-dependent methyltransferase n=1 Tax=Pelagicoccus sp. SDUM812005 TaxID=3041257 RepID=UPI00280DAC9A|nr:class I SAM-dependent methyltransferase [Pelagicoccus sp. SDUM812005]MDQ8179079.1 class I SAM-dependent methyltransferase [Pelagicoccus sp. SDUM812005]